MQAHAVRRMAADHQQGRHRRRARGVRHRQLCARRPGGMFGINVPSIPVEHQYIVYDESPELKAYRQGGGRELAVLRESRQVLLPARGAHGLDPGPLRSRRARALRRRRARLVRQEPVRGRPGAPAAARRGGAAARAVARDLRHQGHRQRPHRLHARRQPADRPGVGCAQSVAQRRPQLRHHRRRRFRLAARRVDHRGRARHRHDGGRSAPLRSLHQQALCGGRRTKKPTATCS